MSWLKQKVRKCEKQNEGTVDSLYLELARDQRICSRQREFEIEREKQVTAYTKGLRLQFEIERGSRQRVFEIERVNCIFNFLHLLIKGLKTDQRFFDVFTKRIFYLIIVDGRQQQGKLFEIIFNFSHLLIRGLIKGLKMDQQFFGVLKK